MVEAIVYMSETGHTGKYAELLGERIGLPVYELKTALKELPGGTKIIYLGWLMAGTVKGYKTAQKSFAIKAVCGVGMSGSDAQITDIRKTNHIAESLPLFYLQGGFEIEKLHGIYKFMMKTMKNTVGKKLSEKTDRTAEEDEMLNLLIYGGNKVHEDNLAEIVAWYMGQ